MIVSRSSLLGVFAIICPCLAASAVASDGSRYLEEQLENGRISYEQYLEKAAALGLNTEDQSVTADDAAGASAASDRQMPTISGLLRFDAINIRSNTADVGNGADIGSLKIGLDGKLEDRWKYDVQIELDEGQFVLDHAYLRYQLRPDSRLAVGQMKPPLSFDNLSSSAWVGHFRRSAAGALLPGKRIGLDASMRFRRGLLQGAIHGEESGTEVDDGGSDGVSYIARGLYRLKLEGGKNAIAAVAVERRELNIEQKTKFRTRLDNGISDVRFVDTGKIKDVESSQLSVASLGFMTKSLLLTTEYFTRDLTFDEESSDVSFDGGYISVRCLLGKAKYKFDRWKGKFKIKPKSIAAGATELALRHSWLDLDDGDIEGGKGNYTSLSVSRYLENRIRVGLSFSYLDHDSVSAELDDMPDEEVTRVFAALLEYRF